MYMYIRRKRGTEAFLRLFVLYLTSWLGFRRLRGTESEREEMIDLHLDTILLGAAVLADSLMSDHSFCWRGLNRDRERPRGTEESREGDQIDDLLLFSRLFSILLGRTGRREKGKAARRWPAIGRKYGFYFFYCFFFIFIFLLIHLELGSIGRWRRD